jgi:hypothetical protein
VEVPSHRAEGPGLIHRSCRAIILGRFPEPKPLGAQDATSADRRAVIRGTFAMSAVVRTPRSVQHAAAWPEYLCRAVLHGECAPLPR